MSQLNDRDKKEKKTISKTRLRQRYAGILAIAFPLIGAMGLGGEGVVEGAMEEPVATIILIAAFVLVGIVFIILSTRPDPEGEEKVAAERQAREVEVAQVAEERKKEGVNKYLE